MKTVNLSTILLGVPLLLRSLAKDKNFVEQDFLASCDLRKVHLDISDFFDHKRAELASDQHQMDQYVFRSLFLRCPSMLP